MPQLDRSRVSTSNLLSVVVDGDYYGGSSAAIPFKWESQPGTPRRHFKRSSDLNSPVSAPLTPPPSYFPKPNGSFRPKNCSYSSSPATSSSSSSSLTSSPPRTPVLYGRNSRKSVWFGSDSSLEYGSKHCNGKSSGCYTSIFKMLLNVK